MSRFQHRKAGKRLQVLSWLLAERDPEAWRDVETDRFVLSHGGGYRRAIGLVACLAGALLVHAYVSTRSAPDLVLVASPLIAFFVARVGLSLYDALFVRVLVDEEGIVCSAPLRPAVAMPWSAVTDVGFSPTMGSLSFRSPKHPTIRVSMYRNGLATLARSVRTGTSDAFPPEAVWLLEAKAQNPR